MGLSRTGTKSLSKALEALGYRSKHQPTSLVDVLDYDACCDTSISVGYKFLDVMFPGSKFILTVREESAWADSVLSQWSGDILLPDSVNGRLRRSIFGSMPLNSYNKISMIRIMHEHNIGVRDYFHGTDQLLVMCVSDSPWGRLCRFLDRPEPSSQFPWENKGVS